MPKYNNNFMAVDFETGGIPAKLKKKAVSEIAVTEFAAVIIDNETLEIKDSRSWLFKPYKEGLIYQKEALNMSGITEALLEEKGWEMGKAMEDIKKFFKQAKNGKKLPYLVGQNIIDFDLDFVEGLWEINDEDISELVDTSRIYDTLHIARDKYIEMPSFNLSSIVQILGLDLVQAHRAEADTIATAKVFIEFMKCLRGEGLKKEEGILEEKRYRENFYL